MSDINKKKKLLDPSSITYGDIIGEGGFAIVFKAQLKNEDGTTLQVAAKRLDFPDEKEIEYLSKLSHPNIISYIGYFKEDESLTTAITIITELAEKGDLRSYLKSSSGPLAVDLASRWIKEAGRAVQYLHDNAVVHRDIKSNNYLILADHTLKLADFGLAKDLDETMSTVTTAQTVSDILEGWKQEAATQEKMALESNVYHPEMQSELKKQQEQFDNQNEGHSKAMNDLEEMRQLLRAKGKAKTAKKAKTPTT